MRHGLSGHGRLLGESLARWPYCQEGSARVAVAVVEAVAPTPESTEDLDAEWAEWEKSHGND